MDGVFGTRRVGPCYLVIHVQRRPATGWPPIRAPHVTRSRITGVVGLLQTTLRAVVWSASDCWTRAPLLTAGRSPAATPRSLALANVGHTKRLDLAVLLEPGREVERVTDDVLEDVEAAAGTIRQPVSATIERSWIVLPNETSRLMPPAAAPCLTLSRNSSCLRTLSSSPLLSEVMSLTLTSSAACLTAAIPSINRSSGQKPHNGIYSIKPSY